MTSHNRQDTNAQLDVRNVEALKLRAPLAAYLSGDGKQVTTFTGAKLGDVTYSKPCKLTRPSIAHDKSSYKTVWVTDVHGGRWIARGSPGVLLTLRPVK